MDADLHAGGAITTSIVEPNRKAAQASGCHRQQRESCCKSFPTGKRLLLALPSVLEPGEVVESASIGAGTSGAGRHDLETDRRIAEFKFIHWRGNDAVRLRTLFADFASLARDPSTKTKHLYVTGLEHPKRFLSGSSTRLDGVCTAALRSAIRAEHPEVETVREYFEANVGKVELVDLAPVLRSYQRRIQTSSHQKEPTAPTE